MFLILGLVSFSQCIHTNMLIGLKFQITKTLLFFTLIHTTKTNLEVFLQKYTDGRASSVDPDKSSRIWFYIVSQDQSVQKLRIFMALSLIFYSTNIHNWGQELQCALGVNWTLVEAGITRGCGELANT